MGKAQRQNTQKRFRHRRKGRPLKAIKVGKLYDGTKRSPVDSAIVVFEDGVILEVIENSNLDHIDKYGTDVEDRSDLVMTPGIIDSHVHLMLPGDGTLGEDLMRSRTPGEIQIIAYKNAEAALRSGVTTIRDVGAALDIDLSTRAYYRNAGEIGPDILCCGKPVTSTGGHCHYMGAEADSPTEIRKIIRTQQKKGTDWVKVMATAGGTRGISQGDPFTLEELQAAVAEAHRQGMGITMHASRINGLRKVAASAPDGIEHCQFTDNWKVVEDKALAETICRNNTHPCHTMAVNVSLLSQLVDKPEELWSEDERNSLPGQRRWVELMPAQLAFQLSQGVPTVGGSDAGWRFTKFHDGMVISMEMMALAGMNTVDIIHSCTGLNAEYLGIGDRLGTIEAGKQADFLLLEEDPGENISNFRTIRTVYKKGYPIQSMWTAAEKSPRWMKI